MSLFAFLVYTNIILGTINSLILVEVSFHVSVLRQCRISKKAHTIINPYPYLAALLVSEPSEKGFDLVCPVPIITTYHTLIIGRCLEDIGQIKIDSVKIRSESVFWNKGGKLHQVVDVYKKRDDFQDEHVAAIGIITVFPAFKESSIIRLAGPRYQWKQRTSSFGLLGWKLHINKRNIELANTSSAVEMTHNPIKNCYRIPGTKSDHKRFPGAKFCGGFNRPWCFDYEIGSLAVFNRTLLGVQTSSWSICGEKEHLTIFTDVKPFAKFLMSKAELLGMTISYVD